MRDSFLLVTIQGAHRTRRNSPYQLGPCRLSWPTIKSELNNKDDAFDRYTLKA